MQVEDDYRHMIVFAQGECGTIHDTQPHIKSLHVAYFFKFFGVRIALRIVVVNAIYVRRFKQYLRVQFDGAQSSSRVSCEKRVATTSR